MLDQPQFITQCETDDEGNLILNFPEELLEAMGWKEGMRIIIAFSALSVWWAQALISSL